MIEDHFPEFYKKVNTYSMAWQRRFLRSQQVQLLSLIAAAFVAGVGGPGWLAVVAFVIATFAHLYRFISRADEKWWNGRAGAESAKTLGWRYVMGGLPFPTEIIDADVQFSARVSDIAKKVADYVPTSTGRAHLGPEMKTLRSSDLQKRVSTYQIERIQDQMGWYEGKSTFNDGRSRWWSWVIVAIQALGLSLAVLALVFAWPINFLGLFTAVAAAGAAWVATKQHATLARSYAVASHELADIDAQITATATWTEDDWAQFVNESEEAISREHTSWRASRGI